MGHRRADRVKREDRLVVQPRLMVGEANDHAEHEADHMAERALAAGGSSASVHHAGAPQGDALGGLTVDPAMEQRINTARSGGSSLEAGVQSSMESAFGQDLSGVRVHADSESDTLNRSLQAQAFTTGSDIFFSKGSYSPTSAGGAGLLAHELAHVVQQGGDVHRATIRRAVSPGTTNFGGVNAAVRFSGGMANKGVFMLTDADGTEVVAKFIDEDPRRAQMADEVLGIAGVGSSGGKPYGMDVGGRIIAKVREVAQSMRANGGDANLAQYMEDGAAIAEGQAQGVVLMNKMVGTDLGDVLAGSGSQQTDETRRKATQSGVDPVALLANGTFHHNLGRMYVADGLLGSSDRFAHEGGKARINAKNMKVLANGQINTFDSDTVLVGMGNVISKKSEERSAENWTKWLLEGGRVWDVGIMAPGAFTQNLLTMFDVSVRKEMFDELVATFKDMADQKDWSQFQLDFATFDARFLAGIVAGARALVAQMDGLVRSSVMIGGEDAEKGVNSEAMRIKGGFLRSVLPDLERDGNVTNETKAAATARAVAMAEQFVPQYVIRGRAIEIGEFNASMLRIPNRPAELGTMEKFGRKVGRLVGSKNPKSDKSKKAKNLRKGADGMTGPELDKAFVDVKKFKDGSHRQDRAKFDIGLQSAIMMMHRQARVLEDADDDAMKLSVITDAAAKRRQLDPYLQLVTSGTLTTVMQNYKTMSEGYSAQLTRSSDSDLRDEIARAQKSLDETSGGFEAGVDYIERELRKMARG